MITYNDIHEAKKNPLVLFCSQSRTKVFMDYTSTTKLLKSPRSTERRFLYCNPTEIAKLLNPHRFFFESPQIVEWWHFLMQSDEVASSFGRNRK